MAEPVLGCCKMQIGQCTRPRWRGGPATGFTVLWIPKGGGTGSVLSEALIASVKTALEEFSVVYQPQYHLATGEVAVVEALLRWQPAEGPPISPAEFIPLAERSDLIHRLGDWVMEAACHQRARWRDAVLAIERIDINFSGRQKRIRSL